MPGTNHLIRFLIAIFVIASLTSSHAQPPPARFRALFGSQTLGNPPVALDERVWHMKFSPDGRSLFTVTDQIQVVDWQKKLPQVIWQPHENETLTRAFFSPDCSLFARLSQDDKVHVHETSTGKVLHTFDRRAPGSLAVAWAPDQELIAVGGHKQILIYQARSGELVREIPQGKSDVTAVAISPDGKLLVAANRSDDEGGDGLLLHHLDGQTPPIKLPGTADRSSECHLSFSPDSGTLAVFCRLDRRNTLYVWDLAAGRIVRQQNGGYNAIVHSPDGNLLAACGLNNLQIWDARTGGEVFHHEGESINEHIWSIAFSPDGHTLAAGIENRIKFWDTREWKEIDPDPDLHTPVSALAFTSDGRRLVTGCLNGDLILWDWQTKKPVWKKPALPEQWHISSLTIDPTNTLLAVNQWPRNSDEPCLRLLDLATGEIRQALSVPPSSGPPDTAFLFRSRGKTALISNHHTILEWDIPGNRLIRTISIPFMKAADSGPAFSITTLQADPDDPDLIWWTAKNLFGAIRLSDLTESCTFDANHPPRDTDPVPPRIHRIINMGSRVWNLPSLHGVRSEGENNDPAVSYPFGNLLFIGRHGKVLVFDILSQTVIHEFDFGNGDIKAITLTPDGKTLVAASTSGLHYRDLVIDELPVGTSTELLWQLMGSDDHWQAYRAAWALARQPDFIPFLSARLKPASEIPAAELNFIQSLLIDGSTEVRQTAARGLLDLGLPLTKEIYETLRKDGLPSQHALENLFGVSNPSPPIPILIPLSEHRRAMRAIMILLEDASPAALEHLKLLASGRAEAPVTIASRTALKVHAAK